MPIPTKENLKRIGRTVRRVEATPRGEGVATPAPVQQSPEVMNVEVTSLTTVEVAAGVDGYPGNIIDYQTDGTDDDLADCFVIGRNEEALELRKYGGRREWGTPIIDDIWTLTLSGTWATNDTVTMTTGGQNSITTVGGTTTLSAIATAVAANWNAAATPFTSWTAAPSGATVVFTRTDGRTRPISVAEGSAAGNVSIAHTQSGLPAGTPVFRVDEMSVAASSIWKWPGEYHITLDASLLELVYWSEAGITGSTIYLRHFGGNRIAIPLAGFASGNNQIEIRTFTETGPRVAVPATTLTPFDVFAYWDGSAVQLTTVNWVGTYRGYNIEGVDGIVVYGPDVTKRYVGSGCTTADSGVCADTITKRYISNQPGHRRLAKMFIAAPTGPWAYGDAFRSVDADDTIRVGFLCGMPMNGAGTDGRLTDYPIVARARLFCHNASGGDAATGIGLDSTSVNSAQMFGATMHAGAASGSNAAWNVADCFYTGRPQEGLHYLQLLEAADAGTTWKGSKTYGAGCLMGEIWC